MSNCVVTIEIQEYLPEGLNFDNFSFIFRSEIKGFEEEITYSNKNSLIHKTLTKKDIKYTIKITKAKSLIGIADFIIPHSILIKKEETYSKYCQLTMTESMKRLILGNSATTDSIKILVSATIQYIIKPVGVKESHSLPKKEPNQIIISQKAPNIQKIRHDYFSQDNRNTKTPPLNTAKSLTYKHPSSTKKSCSTNQSRILNTKKDQSLTDSNILISDRKTIPAKEPQKNISQLDRLLGEELPPIDKQFLELMAKCTDEKNITELKGITDETLLLKKTKEKILKMIKMQKDYHQIVNKSLDDINSLKKLIVQYNENYRCIMKKRHRLEERNDYRDFKININNTVISVENQRTKEAIPISKEELTIYKNVFEMFKSKTEGRVAEAMNQESKNKDLLTFILNNIIQTNANLFKDIPDSLRESLKHIITKYSLQKLPIQSVNKEEQTKENEVNEKGIKDPNEDREYTENEDEQKDTVNKMELFHIISNSIDETDIKLDHYLNYFYARRKIVKIPLRKTSANNYEYGTQKVMIKKEGETFRVRHIGGYVILDKFIEVNAPIEEANMKNPKKDKAKHQQQPKSSRQINPSSRIKQYHK